MTGVRVLVVEDDEELAEFLRRVLKEEGFEVEGRSDGRSALAALEGPKEFHVVVLDRMLPDRDGVSVCAAARTRGCQVPILMLTALGELEDRVRGLEAGADDYLVKPFEVEELVARLRALLRRAGVPPLFAGLLRLDWRNRSAWVGSERLDLTAREFALLAHLARQPDRVVTRGDLLASVWDTRFDPGTNVVEVYVNRLRNKLGKCAWMLETVRGAGYRLRSDPG